MEEAPAGCPRCGESLKKNAFGIGNKLIEARFVDALNLSRGENFRHACEKCTTGQIANAEYDLRGKAGKIRQVISDKIERIPILSIERPHSWEYRSLGIVTAQSTTGTGPISELTTAWTDLFGLQSKRYNNKIMAGENLCKGSLRLQALAKGGNAVIGVDVDYAEVGGQRAMLMVCMTGTAILLDRPDDHWPDLSIHCADINLAVSQLDEIEAVLIKIGETSVYRPNASFANRATLFGAFP